MNQSRLEPRQWAFVVVAGGALLALPFMQLSPGKEAATTVDVSSIVAMDALIDVAGQVGTGQVGTGQVGTGNPTAASLVATGADVHAASDPAIEESQSKHKLPAWAEAHQSPFDALMQEKVQVPSVAAPEVLPLQPLRPWITPPPKAADEPQLAEQSGGATDHSLLASNDPASQTPWSEKEVDSSLSAPKATRDMLASSSSALSVDAWPDERFSDSQVARQLADKYQLQSAIVPADQVLPPPATSGQFAAGGPGAVPGQVPSPGPLVPSGQFALPGQVASATAPVITRQPGVRSVTAPRIRFGQSAPATSGASAGVPGIAALQEHLTPPPAMQPLPTLPPARQGHVIFQPR